MSTLTDPLDTDGAPAAASDSTVFGGVEAGGTKWVCATGTGPRDLTGVEVIPTTTPPETLGRVIECFKRDGVRVAALGVGSFGPVDLRVGSETFGSIMKTAKPGWSNTDVVGALIAELDLPVAFDTDVNAAALAEQRWGAARGLSDFIYITVGTGIGAGIVLNGRPVHGRVHPEFGHILVPHDDGDPFPGSCPFHGDCLEGLASGAALLARYGKPAEELDDRAAWALEAHYLAIGIANAILTFSPERVLLGGGVAKKRGLLPLVRARVKELVRGYVELPSEIDRFIVAPALGDHAGVLGAIHLATAAHPAVG